MDSFEVAVSKSGETSVLVKGKRMKRQRPPSPLWSSGGAASSSSSAGDFSPPSSSGKVYESTEEDEDLAHCLILLARGGPRRRRLSQEVSESRRSSKKYTELVAAGASGGDGVARAGFYVYECKTCSRVFPSFQALGGHRASHKKPKTFTSTTEEVMKKSTAAVADSHEYDDDEGQFSKFRAVSSPLCSSLLPVAPNKLPKIHECSICGSEFSSGQALGGHMRRHRAMVGPAGAQVVTVLGLESPVASDHHHHVEEKSSRDDVLSLDLNLPAPAELEEHRDSKFQLVRRPLGLSSPALIDCHY